MNSEPCVRFGMRMSPKISEKPADNRNSSPPNVTLLTDSTSQKFMTDVFLSGSGMKQEMSRTLFPTPACGRWWQSECHRHSRSLSLTPGAKRRALWSDSEREPGEGSLHTCLS